MMPVRCRSLRWIALTASMTVLIGMQLTIHRLFRRELPVILCSGYSDSIDTDSAKAIGIRAFVMKPIAGRALAAVLQKHIRGDSDATA